MATIQEHKSKATHNWEFLEIHRLSEGEFVDWAVTVLFYCAVHWLRALLAQEGYQVKNYRDEDDAIRGTGIFTLQALQWYRHLKDSSRQARYAPIGISTTLYRELRENCFDPFKAFVASKLQV